MRTQHVVVDTKASGVSWDMHDSSRSRKEAQLRQKILFAAIQLIQRKVNF